MKFRNNGFEKKGFSTTTQKDPQMTPKSDPIGLKFGVSSIHGYMNVFCDFEQKQRGKCFSLIDLAWNKPYIYMGHYL